ncbi:CAAD domain-containing protein [Planktothrix pseudagardhii]|uniref:Glutamate--tRNA ligase n=1 Tax=Planktothrix pseudagardhii TaxID=132604 RepID=A0A9W4CFT5_9CYAN|nr:CAAD domain-containing protein [Planktothrix pseudagardhii]CAD5924201.1 Glutamate--tRNA ligase [Planktothrix pseudagardhii]
MANSPRSRKSSDAKGNSSQSKKPKPTVNSTPAQASEAETGANSPLSPSSEPPVAETPVEESVTPAEPITDEAIVEQVLEELPPVEEPTSEPVATEHPVVEEPTPEPVATEHPVEEPTLEPITDQAIVEQVLEELPLVDEPTPEPIVEEPVAVEEPTPEPVVEEPVTDETVVEQVIEELPPVIEPTPEPVTDQAIVEQVLEELPPIVEPELAEPQPQWANTSATEVLFNAEPVTTPATKVEVVIDSPTSFSYDSVNQSIQPMKEEILAFLSQLPENLGGFFKEYKRPLTTVGLLIALLVTFKILTGLVEIINEIPLIKPTFETVGLGYSAWFIYRYLLKAETRKELSTDFNTLKEEILGKKS